MGHAFVWSSIKHQSPLRRQETVLITHNTCGFVGRDEPEAAMTTDPRRSRIGTCAAVHRTRSLDLSPPPHEPLRAVVSIGAAATAIQLRRRRELTTAGTVSNLLVPAYNVI